MYDPSRNLAFMTSWMQFGTAYSQMAMSAGEVIVRRAMRMSQGDMSQAEVIGMMMEKATAFATASERAVVAASRGQDAAMIATAALKPYGQKTRSNVRKLRR